MKIEDFINEFDQEKQQEVYLQYKKDLKTSRLTTFEEWLEDNYIFCEDEYEWVFNNGNYTKCDSCGSWYSEDYISSTQDGSEMICEQCFIDGYGA